MPIMNNSKNKIHPFTIYGARTFLSRLIGLLGTDRPIPYTGLHIVPCTGIHTFGMKYPVDILFLDKTGRVIHILQNMKPNRSTKIIPQARSVIELPSGSIEQHLIETGDCLDVTSDVKHRPRMEALSDIFHWPINVAIALLWSKFVLLAVGDWLSNSAPINLGILIHNTLLFVLFLTRRKSSDTSARVLDWVIPIFTLASAMMLISKASAHGTLLYVSGILQIIGIVGILFSLLSLGRSFGIIPANRHIKSSGAYRLIRHPLYTSELIFYFGFLMGNFIPRNIILVLFIVVGQLWRSISEENLLSKDPGYRTYLNYVRYRFIPGLF